MFRAKDFLVMVAIGVVLIGYVGQKKIEIKRNTKPSRGFMKWSDDDMRLFKSELDPLGIPLEDSLLVYTCESGLDPQACSGIAWGIPQLTNIAAKEIGWTRPLKEFGTLSVSQQIPWIAKLQAAQIRLIGYTPKNALELYIANLSPRAAKAHDAILYRRGSSGYEANAALDRDHKGWIADTDLEVSLNRARSSATYQSAVEQLRRIS